MEEEVASIGMAVKALLDEGSMESSRFVHVKGKLARSFSLSFPGMREFCILVGVEFQRPLDVGFETFYLF